MSLVTWDDLQAQSGETPTAKIFERIQARITDAQNPMPPAGRPALTDAERATLSAYVSGGAQRASASCTEDTTPQDGASSSGTASANCDPNDENGGFGCYNPPDSDCEVMQELRAHGGQTADDTTPFEPPQGGDHYEIFWFTPKWTKKMHVIRLDPLVDNGAVLHHWLLYMRENADNPDGSHQSDVGLQASDSQLLSGWAPGNESIPTGTKTGLRSVSGPNGRFGIEIHFNTSANPPNRKDRSGVRICATSKLREREAAVHWLGTQGIVGIGKFDITGTCTPKNESHIIATSPHMHLRGTYMKSVVTHADGTTATIVDKPFDFNDQAIYPIHTPSREIVVKPGDKILTTCSYDAPNFITFGPNTSDEMCYNFVVAWPAGSLTNGSTGLVGGQNSCIDGI